MGSSYPLLAKLIFPLSLIIFAFIVQLTVFYTLLENCLNRDFLLVSMRENMDQKKNPYFDTFHTVTVSFADLHVYYGNLLNLIGSNFKLFSFFLYFFWDLIGWHKLYAAAVIFQLIFCSRVMYQLHFKSAFTFNWDEISSRDEFHSGTKKFLFTPEFHPGIKRVEFHP